MVGVVVWGCEDEGECRTRLSTALGEEGGEQGWEHQRAHPPASVKGERERRRGAACKERGGGRGWGGGVLSHMTLLPRCVIFEKNGIGRQSTRSRWA